jgi:ubiquinol-cytochrome c reductase iron-sulfur subunit
LNRPVELPFFVAIETPGMPNSRRQYLSAFLKVLIMAGLVVAAIPFIASLREGPVETGRHNPWQVEVDLSDLSVDRVKRVDWPGGEVWITRRSPAEIQRIQSAASPPLRDPDSHLSRQPAVANTSFRSLRADIFVFLPRETQRGCHIHSVELEDGRPGFVEPCYGARFDSAGRIFRDSGRPEQRNLPVPPYELLPGNRLRLLQQTR